MYSLSGCENSVSVTSACKATCTVSFTKYRPCPHAFCGVLFSLDVPKTNASARHAGLFTQRLRRLYHSAHSHRGQGTRVLVLESGARIEQGHKLTSSCSAQKFFSTALATAPSASDTRSSELDHSVNTGPHSFSSVRYSAGAQRSKVKNRCMKVKVY